MCCGVGDHMRSYLVLLRIWFQSIEQKQTDCSDEDSPVQLLPSAQRCVSAVHLTLLPWKHPGRSCTHARQHVACWMWMLQGYLIKTACCMLQAAGACIGWQHVLQEQLLCGQMLYLAELPVGGLHQMSMLLQRLVPMCLPGLLLHSAEQLARAFWRF